jgi:NADH-quinone oxidoreductase subunit L
MTVALWLVPGLPLAASVAIALFAIRSRAAGWIAVAAVAGSASASFVLLTAAARGMSASAAATWLDVGGRRLGVSLRLDPLGALVASTVTVVALAVFVYAIGYMKGKKRVGRFFAQLSLFAGSMLALVLAADLITFFIAWELVGMCSYLLIGFELEDARAGPAASKAMIVTRLGDLALLFAFAALISMQGSADMARMGSAPAWVAALIVVGAAAKSAQVPFQGWLPDAMAGPTPVSALLHSATMVAAGAFLLARLFPLLAGVPGVLPAVAWIGVATSLLGGAVALVSEDLKRTLAYSTMSQLGFMWLAIGSGSVAAGLLLLVTHALYKALLFLVAGAVGQARGGTEFSRLGGLARPMMLTFVVALLPLAALAGLPITLALPPKDPALAAALHESGALFAASLCASFLTAFYAARILWLTFLAKAPRQGVRHPAGPMRAGMAALWFLLPLALLANASVLGMPLAHLLGSDVPESSTSAVLAIGIALLGVAVGLLVGRRRGSSAEWAPGAWVLRGELGLVRAYETVTAVVFGLVRAAERIEKLIFAPVAERLARGALRIVGGLDRIDARVLAQGAVSVARHTLDVARAASYAEGKGIDGAVREGARALLGATDGARAAQTGRIENYLLYAVGALVVVTALGALFLQSH